jgi:ribosomal protein S2
MGVKTIFKKLNWQKYNKSNKIIKGSFYSSFAFFGNNTISTGTYNTNNYLLGKRGDFSIINTEHHIEMLKRTIQFLREVSKKKGAILFVNDQINTKFDGIIKMLSIRAGEPYFVGKWLCGNLTKKVFILPYKAIILFNYQKSIFLVKESNKLGLPLVSLCCTNQNILETMYPIICNNSTGNSLLYFSLILSNSIIESKLFVFLSSLVK